ncbi:phospholipid scramblase 1-like isoform X2 [Tachypleus tridentatus]|uniref:phospholipid scramblase 1-like isoform X2 n=1 Tax=Tachypleus tridentatus TaxID=6853 RepID=UPI003FD41890
MAAPYNSEPGQAWYSSSTGVVGVPPAGGVGYPPPGPAAVQWMPLPSAPPNCPPGLEYLTMIDQLLVHQKVELLEAITGFETANKYQVMNSMGQNIYFAAEDSHCCARYFCGPIRPFDMKILDNGGHEVIHLCRPLKCDSCCCPCCLQVLSRDGGTQVGKITKQWTGFIREVFTDADHFGITFPMNLEVNIKALLLGACFLIDFMFFEKSNN